jgi:malate permease and related proteins
MFSTYSFFYRGKDRIAQPFNLRRLINPVLVTTIVGLAITLIGLKAYVPDFVKTIVVAVGAMASPLFMLILGGTVYHDIWGQEEGQRHVYWSEIVKFVLMKNILFPAVLLGLLVWLRPDYAVALIIMLQAAVPPVTAIPIFAERSGGSRTIASQIVVGSFLASIVSIPVVILVFSHFFPFPK